MNDLAYLPRVLARTVEDALAELPVVVVTGARQTGKTTLVQHLPSSPTRRFRTLDDLRVLEVGERDPELLLREAPSMTIDEVQRAPALLRAVKLVVDHGRRPGRFLLTGSANLLLMRAVSETLAGRAVYLRLLPLTESEKASGPDPLWSALVGAADVDAARRVAEPTRLARCSWVTAAAQGGYPPVVPLSLEGRSRWFDGYVATYLERDLQQLAGISALHDFRRLIEVAALRVGGILNQADLARDAGLARPTAHRYLGLLEVSFQLRLLRPYARGRTQRLVKSPKLYWTDTGLGAHLAGLGDPAELLASPRRGVYLENLLLCHLDAWRETVTPRPEVYYWRTTSGAEVDLVVEQGRHLLPVEVKASRQVRASDAEGVERFLADHRHAAWGLVAYTGDEVVPLTARVLAVPVDRLL
jgi:hypothetical protein